MDTHRFRGEHGASLIIAMAFITLFSVLSVSVLALTGTTAKVTTTAKSVIARDYSADAGIEAAVKDLASNQTLCTTASPNYTLATPFSLNGKNVTYTCSGTGGTSGSATGSPLLGGQYSAISTATVASGNMGIWVDGTSPATVNLTINGSYYTGADFHFDDATHETVNINGNTTAAAAVSPAVCGYPNVVEAGTCSAGSAPSYTTPTVYIPGTSSTNTGTGKAPASWVKTAGTPGCTVMYPGRYGTPGTALPAFTAGKDYYMASGTYYLVNAGVVNLQGRTIFGGAQGSDTKFVTGYSPCATDADAHTHLSGFTASGSGVTIVLGGNTELHVKDSATHVELFSRVVGGTDAGKTSGVSIWASDTTTGTGGAGTYTTSTIGNNNAIIFMDERLADTVFHGLTYVPASKTSIHVTQNAEASNKAVLYGGVVTVKLWIFTTTGDNWTMQIAGSGGYTPPTQHVVNVTAQATDPTDNSTSTITATLTFPIGGGTPTVSDWKST